LASLMTRTRSDPIRLLLTKVRLLLVALRMQCRSIRLICNVILEFRVMSRIFA
jgi:hypothetical protein